jgi:hypothetical protein
MIRRKDGEGHGQRNKDEGKIKRGITRIEISFFATEKF